METKLEDYKVLVINSGHITKDDADILHSITHRHPYVLKYDLDNMIFERDTGWFIKLYEEHYLARELEPGEPFSEALIKIIIFAHTEGYRMIEIDCGGSDYPELFETFDW